MSEIVASKTSLERSKRAILRSLNNDKSTIASYFEQNPSSEIGHKIAACLESWKESLFKLEQIDNELIECSEEQMDAAEMLKYEVEVSKDFSTFKSKYNTAKGQLAALLERLDTNKSTPQSRQSLIPNSSFIEAYQINPLLKIQDIPVPKYDGKRQNFTDWYNEFVSTVHDNTNLTPFQKMYLLKRALVGDAEALLKDYALSGEMYEKAFDYIKERFYNKRVIIAGHFTDLVDLPEMKMPTLRSSFDKIQRVIRGLEVCGLDTKKLSPLITFIVSRKLPERLRVDWENSNHDFSTYPSFDPLATFISNRCFAYESSNLAAVDSPSKPSTSKASTIPAADRKSKAAFSTIAKKSAAFPKCVACEKDHYLSNCDSFTSKKIPERQAYVKEKRLCLNCLRPGHVASVCRSSKCRVCGKSHHTLLHHESNPVPASTSQPVAEVPQSTLTLITKKSTVVLLPTAIVKVRLKSRVVRARVLIDSCSQINAVAESFVKKWRIKTESSSTVIYGVSPQGLRASSVVSLNVQSRVNNFEVSLNAEVVGRIPYEVDINVVRHLESVFPSIELADCGADSPMVDILIGGEFANHILLGNKKLIGDLCLEESKFGWIAAGPLSNFPAIDAKCCHLSVVVQDELAKFWEVEEVSPPKTTSSEHELCEAHFNATYNRMLDGRFQVRLPFKPSHPKLANTYRQARGALLQYESKTAHEIKTLYVDFMREYHHLGHMSLIKSEIVPLDRYYIPHLPVYRPESATTPLRVVFHASTSNNTGISLNQALLNGPVLQPDLFDVLIKFRSYPIAFSADISKMYRQIAIHPDDRYFQSILWRENPDNPIQTYELTTLTYGTTPASYIATKCLQILAKELENTFPEAAYAIASEFYMDDLLTGANSIEEAMRKQKCIHDSLSSAKFPLRKYVSNSPQLLKSLDPALVETLKPISFSSSNAAKVLGLQWHPAGDDFGICVQLVDIANIKLTKRAVSSLIASIFDPLGLVTPVTTRGKILLQDLWRCELGWDDPIPDELSTQFRELYQDLACLANFRVSRPICIGESARYELIGFCDASNRAYGAVIYLKACVRDTISVNIVCAKSKVAPIKILTIPRLELLGAVLLCKLMSRVCESLGFQVCESNAYCDSTIVLAWLKGPATKFETFVRNRVELINATIPFERWNHVKSIENPADLLTRGIPTNTLLGNQMWFRGPEFIRLKAQPPILVDLPLNPPELKKSAVMLTIQSDRESIIERFSNLDKLICVINQMNTFILRARSHNRQATTTPEQALFTIYKMCQDAFFQLEIDLIRQKKELPQKSSLHSLNPFLDETGILRVGGRLENSSLAYDTKHPIILHVKSALARLLVRYIHKKYFHATKSFTLGFLQQKHWFIGGAASLIKREIHGCTWCTRMKAKPRSQLMGNLPADRMNVARPFTISGVDYAGPFTVKCTNHRTYKYIKHYAAIFVCMSTRAVHIESAADLSTKALKAALQRFAARRGVPRTIWSDNGTQFVCMSKNLHSSVLCASTKWKFIPPRSPHHGGIWESAVKNCKKHLLSASKGVIFSEDEFKTTLTIVEAILNSRPLYRRRNVVDTDVIDVLTPGHFLVGSHLLQPCPPDAFSTGLSERLDAQTQILTSFWRQWKKSYMTQLQARAKWRREAPNIEVGDIVLLKEHSSPCGWPLAKVIATFPDAEVGIKAADNAGHSRDMKTMDVTTEILAVMNELEATFPPLQPAYFITKNSTVIMAQTGSIARIPCVVKNLGEATVSWIRRKDYHLLTVGLTSYTVDERYQPVHYQNSEDWTLQIRYVQKRDAGLYECQISSHPPSSIFVDFQVVEAEAQIDGSKEKYLKYGSPLQLTCMVLKSPEIPTYIFWYHNNQMVNYDSHRGFNVTLDLGNKTSNLYVARTTNEHTGNYSCVPSNAHPDSSVVHILNGENPAAMQHGRGRGLSLFHCTSLWLLLISFLTTSILSRT